jgi:hypothetical protein
MDNVAKAYWSYSLANETIKPNVVLENRYKNKPFAEAYPRDTTYMVELTFRRNTMTSVDFANLNVAMGNLFSDLITTKFRTAVGLESQVFRDTYTAISTCSPSSSTINVLLVLNALGQTGRIMDWLRFNFQPILAKYLDEAGYKWKRTSDLMADISPNQVLA